MEYSEYLDNSNDFNTIYSGKVRIVKQINNDLLLLSTTNKLSSFDKYICDIENKGTLLNNITSWLFDNTSHIIDNHYLFHNQQDMIVKKTQPIKLEFCSERLYYWFH